MAAQAFLHVEGHHLEVLNYNFESWPHVGFPRPFYASSSVIIETFEPGQIVSDFLGHYDELADTINNGEPVQYKVEEVSAEVETTDPQSNTPIVPVQGEVEGHDLVPLPVARFLVTTGLGLYLKMLLVDNLMHADLHSGNIMLDLVQSKKRQPTSVKSVAIPDKDKGPSRMAITLVDAGMVAQLTDLEGSVFVGLLASLGSGNGKEAAMFAMQFSDENQITLAKETRQHFTDDMIQLFRVCCRGYGTGVDVGEVLRGVLGLIRKHQIRIDANYATLVVNILCTESLARRMFPNYNLLDAARPLLESYRGMCYTRSGLPKPSARRSSFVKFWLSVMYMKKRVLDGAFFWKEARQKRLSSRNPRQAIN